MILNIVGFPFAIIGCVLCLGVIAEAVHIVVRVVTMGLDEASAWFYNNHSKGIGKALELFRVGTFAQRLIVAGGGGLVVTLAVVCICMLISWILKPYKWILLIWGALALLLCALSLATLRYFVFNGIDEFMKLMTLYQKHGGEVWDKLTKKGDGK
jgi:hypothetical protein